MALFEIKKRLESVADTRKITQALQMVAASRMKGFQRKAVHARAYTDALLQALRLAAPKMEELPLFTPRTTGRTVFVLLTANKGLCGALNARLVSELFSSERFRSVAPERRALMTVGNKGYEAALRAGYPVERHFSEIGEDIDALQAMGVIGPIVSAWESGEASEVVLCAPHYHNPFESNPTVRDFLPLAAALPEPDPEIPVPRPYFEPDPARVADALSHQVIESLFLQAFYELKAAEYSSRMVAMQKASDAASDVVSALTLEYNKTRQAAITAQLSELACADEAMQEEEPIPAAVS